ncbi:MAG: Hsp70 family protein [Dehalococcoidia bacterium]
MELSVGLDFGTSNSSVAVYDGEKLALVPLDPEAPDVAVMRTLLYLARDGGVYYGQAALDRYLEQNVGRPVKLERRYVGTSEMTFASTGTITKDTHALVDVNEPWRLFQSIKTFLPDSTFKGTNVYGTFYTLDELIAQLTREMLARVERFTGSPVARLTVGRPVHFSDVPENDRLSRERQEAAFGRLAVPVVRYLEEPVAAAYEYARNAAASRRALVFDFGGGTLDVTVIHTRKGVPEVLATGGVPVGGDLLDRRIVETHLLAHFGEGATVGRRQMPLPRYIFGRLLHWQSMALLNRPDTVEVIRNAIAESDRPGQLKALLTLISRTYGLELFRTVEETKRLLSERQFTTLEFQREGIDVREPLSRADFESAIHAQFVEVERCVLDTVARSGVRANAIDAIVTTGGSSRIPLFRQMLQQHFPAAELAERSAFTSVAAGLAVAGASA